MFRTVHHCLKLLKNYVSSWAVSLWLNSVFIRMICLILKIQWDAPVVHWVAIASDVSSHNRSISVHCTWLAQIPSQPLWLSTKFRFLFCVSILLSKNVAARQGGRKWWCTGHTSMVAKHNLRGVVMVSKVEGPKLPNFFGLFYLKKLEGTDPAFTIVREKKWGRPGRPDL